MKKLIAVAFLFVAIAYAQTLPTHKITLNWIASPDAATIPTITYNIYRASGACPTVGSPAGAVEVGSTLAGVTTYVDTNVSPTQSYCYFVRAALNGVESLDSVSTVAVVPLARASGLSAQGQ